MKQQQIKAFTLVELIIVITILAILRTIGFMSYQSYTIDARDTNRVTTIKSVQDGLEIYTIKSSSYPLPDTLTGITNGTSTGIVVYQGKLGNTVSSSIKMTSKPLDPSTSQEYTYSVSQNQKYYQIAINKEGDSVSYSPVSQTYAQTSSAIVKGNYKFDPSLPSLVTVASSLTSSGIFSPKVCFVLDNGKNSLDNCVEKKEDMSLKDFDSSLVGYWDMETLTGVTAGFSGYLADLSGNGNNGTFSGDLKPNSTEGYLGKALLFSSGTIDCGSGNTLYTKDSMTIISIIKPTALNNSFPRILQKGNAEYLLSLGNIAPYINSFGVAYYNSGGINNISPYSISNIINLNNYYILTTTLKDKTAKLYLNGILVELIQGTNNNNPLFNIMRDTGGNLYIGNQGINLTRQFNGTIDDIKIYNRALSDSEIAQQARIAGFGN